MSADPPPLILLTNDDGVASPGLRALIHATADLGQVLVVAPRYQQSSTGRALSGTGIIREEQLDLEARPSVKAYSVEGTPALTVRSGILLLAPRPVSLVVSGVNYGENIGSGITVSGTVCAGIEAASFGIPSIAVSLETDLAEHFSHSDQVDFGVAAAFARRVASYALRRGALPAGADMLKVDIPSDATPDTPWRATRLTRQRYFDSTVSVDRDGTTRFTGYQQNVDLATLEPDSDAYALLISRVISVAPMTIDLSASMPPEDMSAWLTG